MANLSEDIQCAGSDTRPPMLDRTDFASWQQRIRLYCRGKENGVNILKFLGTTRVYSDLSPEDKERYNADIRATNILLQGLPKDITLLSIITPMQKDNMGQCEDAHGRTQLNSKFVNNMLPEWGRFVTSVKLNRRLRDSNYDQLVGNANPGQARQIKCYNCNSIGHIARNCTQPKHPHNSEYFKDKMLLMQAQENGVALDEEQLLFLAGGQDNAIDEDMDNQPVQDLALNVDNVFQADDCDAFDFDVDEAPTAQTIFMANLSSADPVYDEVGPSYDLDILSEVHDHDHYHDAVGEHHEEHEMHDDVQPTYVVDSHADYTSDSNMIPYDQYVKDNAVPVVQSNVSSTPNDAYMMIWSLGVGFSRCKLKPYYNELNKVAIGYKNPLCLTRAKQVQPALYNGYEIIKNNHVPALVHNTEDTLEIAEITRRKMNDKMKDPECVTHKVKIAHSDYLKENYLATFTPQKQLTPEQIFWSQDLIKMKEEALKKQTTASRPIKALTVYPPNTPATLVPRGSLKGKRGLTQMECYLTEVIPFFKTLKEHFEGIQKALTKEIKEMKDIFEELEAEVDQNVVNRKHDEIERKNYPYLQMIIKQAVRSKISDNTSGTFTNSSGTLIFSAVLSST
ncbi:integrase, catalytic region, zinc finger, CCHC-type containing protein [Tanacetum coccineum]